MLFPVRAPQITQQAFHFFDITPFPIDSIFYNGQIGLIPALPMMVTPYYPYIPPPPISGVKPVTQTGKIDLYPNPVSTAVNVSLQLVNTAKVVSYTIIDGSARIVNRDFHYNVQNEVYTYNTASLPSGNYTMMVRADNNKLMFSKFTVIKQ